MSGEPNATSDGVDPGLGGPFGAGGFVGRLPPNFWPLELLYFCARLHQDAVGERRESQEGYDVQRALQVVNGAFRSLDDLMERFGLQEPDRDLAHAFWERGLQLDLFDAAEAALVEKISSDSNAREVLLGVLKQYLPDPNYSHGGVLSFYGGAALCLRLSQKAGIDHEGLLRDAIERLS